uniref:Putative secreted protein n=1 Tax=Amblyomma cajennense TaxID=34607 RepID=A0A023FBT1_AMBCJ
MLASGILLLVGSNVSFAHGYGSLATNMLQARFCTKQITSTSQQSVRVHALNICKASRNKAAHNQHHVSSSHTKHCLQHKTNDHQSCTSQG